jgi:pyruvate,water dikinase
MGVLLRAPRRDADEISAAGSPDATPAPAIVPLSGAAEAGVEAVGAKAANLGQALAAGLPVLSGFVLTTSAVAVLTAEPSVASDRVLADLLAAFSDLAGPGGRPLVVRSSSPVEDQSASSMAGWFTSVVDVRGWDAFLDAVQAVARSARRPGHPYEAPMAVLVQVHLEPRFGGVLFGLDPVSGRHDRRVVSAVEGGPQGLVSGEVDGTRYLLRPRGRRVEVDGEALALRRRDLRALAELARRAAVTFGGPQDVEWGLDHDGRLWLLQARPITAGSPRTARGPVFGPGPVAETFPEPLRPLEEELWVPPLRQAMAAALRLTGSAARAAIAASPVVVTVGGRVAADLGLLGALPDRPPLWRRLDPRPPVRRLRAAWTVGRLRAALPALVNDVAATVDAELGAVPALGDLSDESLLLLLERARQVLVSVHGHEMLTGLLPAPTGSAAAAAIDALAAGRAQGLADPEVVAAYPVVLALTSPAVGSELRLPGVPSTAGRIPEAAAVEDLGPRETLRLRARWLHELTARVAHELGHRLVARGLLAEAGDVAFLRLADLDAAVRHHTHRQVPAGHDPGTCELCASDCWQKARQNRGGGPALLSPPLPPAFRLDSAERVAPVGTVPDREGFGRGAAAGRGAGVVHGGGLPAPEGSVLVVSTLDPGLAPYLPGLAGLVAETGSVLSHLAILAREFGVPCVVGYRGALERFPAGTAVVVDGATGEVSVLGDRE